MPVPNAQYHDGLAIQIVESNDVADVQRLIYREDIAQLERYIRNCRGKGMRILNTPAVAVSENVHMMVCFVERVVPSITVREEHLVAAFATPINRVMGLPIIDSSVFSLNYENSTYHFASMEQELDMDEIQRLYLSSLRDFSLVGNADGTTAVEVSGAQNIETLSNNSDTSTVNELVILNNSAQDCNWTSLSIKKDADVVSFILNKIPENQRAEFVGKVDGMGWSTLHWSAYQDHVETIEATMDALSIEEQRRIASTQTSDSKGWTLLHCAAVKDSAAAMKALIAKFPGDGSDDTRWKILSCNAKNNGRTALHIAVAEKNVKAAIILLDAAGDRRRDLLHSQDAHERIPQDYSSKFSLLGKYLGYCAEFDDYTLHEAAKRDDRAMVSFIWDNTDNASKRELLDRKNSCGMTVLQLACKHNSVEVLKLLISVCDYNILEECLTRFTDCGDAALHLAARYNKSIALHILLTFVKREDRSKHVKLPNVGGKSVETVAGECSSWEALDTVKYHRLICAESLKEFFLGFSYGLFNVDISDERLKTMHRTIETRTRSELGYLRNVNYDAAKCLMYKDWAKAKTLIDESLKVDPYCIHALCNQGLYLLNIVPANMKTAEEVAYKVLELFSDSGGKPKLLTKIEYAYWVAESEQTNAARDKSCLIFEECLKEAEECEDSEDMKAYCRYFYIKTLVRIIKRNIWSQHSPDMLNRKIDEAISELINLAKAKRKVYEGDIWLWIAELQSCKAAKHPGNSISVGLQCFRKAAYHTDFGGKDTGIESCVNYAIDLENEYDYKIKFLMRVGKLCLELADGTSGRSWLKERAHWLTKALELSEKCSHESCSWYFMCASTCSQALLSLWAMEFYRCNETDVRYQYSWRTERRLGDNEGGTRRAFNFIMFEYYRPWLRTDPLTTTHLGKVRDHLLQIVSNGGWSSHGLKLARVKYLLGHTHLDVVETFRQSLQSVDRDYNYHHHYVRGLQSFGQYYEIINDLHEAERQYRKAVQHYKEFGKSGKPEVAYNGLRIIQASK